MSEPLGVPDWPRRAKALASELADAGALTDPGWRAAVEQTPRHLFVPRFFRDDGSVVDGADPADAGEWLGAVYSDDSLVVQRAAVPGADRAWPTSSSTMPSLMVRMLEMLNVTDRSRVLEIGTATGYNAALLCHRLVDRQVASIELHPELAADAAERLGALGYRPTLAVGDGAAGVPDQAPYDRIIATCAVPEIPAAWIAQLAPGGRIVADLRGEMSSSLAVLDNTDPGTVTGRLLDQAGHFMWLRPDPDNPLRDAHRFEFVADLDTAETTTTDLDPEVLAEPGLRVLLGILEPTLSPPSRGRRDGADTWWMHAEGGCWVEVVDRTVTQGGPRHLWPTVEYAVTEWRRLDRPGRGRYGLTVTGDGVHRYWLDQPDHTVAFTNVVATRPDLTDELLRRQEVDQQARSFALEGREATDAEIKRLREVDRDNTAWLETVITENGWPGIRLAGQAGARAAWLLAQHADAKPELQRQWLALLRAAVEAGDAERGNLAYLQDRVAIHQHLPQHHGTQFLCLNGKDGLAPLEDPQRVNEYRATAGLHPLTDDEISTAWPDYP